MTPLYRLATKVYHRGIALAGRWGNDRAARWVSGRQGQITPPKPVKKRRVWMHCASLGEWEQGRPVLEKLREALPEWEFVLSFFSPSGYDRTEASELLDHVLYLPPDSPENAEDWVRELAPDLAIFVKYEFWFYHLSALRSASVPTWLVAATFRKEQLFFKLYGGWYRRMLDSFTGIVVQTEASRKLLVKSAKYPRQRVFVAGDPRMDRTRAITLLPFSDPTIEAFCAARPTIIAGSVWPDDLDMWLEIRDDIEPKWNLLFAPHQLDEADLARTQVQWEGVRYTQAEGRDLSEENVLILDTIGMLSKVYRYGTIAYVGGAFRTGLHNTLEPMAYGLPTIFGPRHRKFPEAAAAIDAGGAFSVNDPEDLLDTLHELSEPDNHADARDAQLHLADQNAGAGERTVAILLRHLKSAE